MEESFLAGEAQISGHGGGRAVGVLPAGTRCRWSEPGSSHPVKGKGAQLQWLWGVGVRPAPTPQQELLLCVPSSLGSESEGGGKGASQEEVVFY